MCNLTYLKPHFCDCQVLDPLQPLWQLSKLRSTVTINFQDSLPSLKNLKVSRDILLAYCHVVVVIGHYTSSKSNIFYLVLRIRTVFNACI